MSARQSVNGKWRKMTEKPIYVAGHRGLVGSALVRRLKAEGCKNLITRTHAELDLERRDAVQSFFAAEKPEVVFLAAAKVGGIHANNTYPVDFLLSNLRIQNNVIEASWRYGVKTLLFLGSSCIYPKLAPQPLKEEYLLSSPLEPTNEPYAIAKIAGIKLCGAFNRQYGTRYLCVMPTNLFGPNDNYDLLSSHVLPALIRKFHLARLASRGDREAIEEDEQIHGVIPEDFRGCLEAIAADNGHRLTRCPSSAPLSAPAVILWGTGSPYREFLYSDDLADACLFLLRRMDGFFDGSLARSPGEDDWSDPLINIGTGKDSTIRDLADIVRTIIGFEGPVQWDRSKPDGTPRKLLDISLLTAMGWRPHVGLKEGIRMAYEDYIHHSSKESTGRAFSEIVKSAGLL